MTWESGDECGSDAFGNQAIACATPVQYIDFGSYKQLVLVVIYFDRTRYPAQPADPPYDDRVAAVAHEWGHALNLAHPVPLVNMCTANSVMGYLPNTCLTGPTPGDRDTVRCTVYQRCTETKNLLTNASFETGSNPPQAWSTEGPTNRWVYSGGSPRSGNYYLQMNRQQNNVNASAYQEEAGLTLTPGESYVFTVWARSPSGQCVTVNLLLWGMPSGEGNGTGYSICSTNWTPLSAPLDVAVAGNNKLRAQIYIVNPTPALRNLDIDSTEVIKVPNRNASFERGNGGTPNIPYDWTLSNPSNTNWARYTPGRSGNWYLEANTNLTGSSIRYDVPMVPSPRESYTFGAWVRAPQGTLNQGRIAIWALGGTQESASYPFTAATSTWTYFWAQLDVKNKNHTSLRVEIYLDTAGSGGAYGPNYDFDGTQLVRNLVSNASFEAAEVYPVDWKPNEAATNRQAYNNGVLSKNGSWFLQTNTSIYQGSVFQDIPITPAPYESYSFVIWAKCHAPPTCPPGGIGIDLVLWGLGNINEANTTTYYVGTTWTPIIVPLDVGIANHTAMRAQIYLRNGGRNYDIDATGNSVLTSAN